MKSKQFLIVSALLLAWQVVLAKSLPSHPDKLKYPHFKVSIPDSGDYEHPLDGGNIAFIREDHSLPLINIHLYSRAGTYAIEGHGDGLAELTASMLRDGGTQAMTPDQLDERLDFLATSIRVAIGNTSSSANLDTLSRNLDESLGLFFDVLTKPRFDAERLSVAKAKVLEGMKRRNDDTRNIEPRVWQRLLQGENFFTNAMSSKADIDAIDAAAMTKASQTVFASGHLIFAISGDINAKAIIAKLNEKLKSMPVASNLPPVPDNPKPSPPGLFAVRKADVTQSRVSIGEPGLRLGDPDQIAFAVMNQILGAGGFTSRIMSRVRSDEGLAYSAGSSFRPGIFFPGVFRAFYQSKNPSVAYALKIVLQEIARIRNQPVSKNELEIAKQGMVSRLGVIFRNASGDVTRFAQDALQHRAKDYWKTYADRVNAVTAADVQRVAKAHLNPEQLRILVVGALAKVKPGDGSHGSLEVNAGMPLTQLPLRDPMTLEPLPLTR